MLSNTEKKWVNAKHTQICKNQAYNLKRNITRKILRVLDDFDYLCDHNHIIDMTEYAEALQLIAAKAKGYDNKVMCFYYDDEAALKLKREKAKMILDAMNKRAEDKDKDLPTDGA
jgi:hypothetical protein